MKDNTRERYMGRIDNAIRMMQAAIQAVPQEDQERIKKYLDIFNDGQAIRVALIDGERTTILSNRLNSYESRIARISGIEELAEGEGEESTPTMQDGSVGARIIEMIGEAQAILLRAYETATEFNAMASDVPAVKDLQVKANSLTPVMQELSRVRGLS